MIIKRNIRFAPHKRGGDSTIFPLRMRVSYEGHKFDFPTGISVDINCFEKAKDKERVTGCEDAGKINSELTALEAKVDEIFTRFELIEKRIPDPSELKLLLKKKRPEKIVTRGNDVYRHFEEFMRITGKKNAWEQPTYDKYKYLQSNLKTFDAGMTFEDINEEKMLSLLQHFYKERMMNSTIGKYLSMFRSFLRWAKKRGLYGGDQHEEFKPRLKGKDNAHHQVIFLTWEELMALREYKFEKRQLHLEHTRDCLLFLCFTGLRYSDLWKLLRMDVKKDSFSFVSRKGAERLTVDLNQYSREILDRYKKLSIPRGRALPVISNQKMNENVKTVCELAGITEMTRQVIYRANKRQEEVGPKYSFITTHCGRRSFIVNALYLGIGSEVIMKWTGHADFRAMRPYIAIVDKLRVQEMKKFDR